MSSPTSLRPRVLLLSLCSLALLAAAGANRKARTLHVRELILSSEDGSVNFRFAVEGDALVLRRLEPAQGHIRFLSRPDTTAIELVDNATGQANGRMWVAEDSAGLEFQTGPDQPSARLASSAEGAELVLRGPEWGGAVIAEVNRESQGGRLQLGEKGPAVRLSPKPEGMNVEALREGQWTLVDELP